MAKSRNAPKNQTTPIVSPTTPAEFGQEAHRLVFEVAVPSRHRAHAAGRARQDDLTAMHVDAAEKDTKVAGELLSLIEYHADVVRITTALVQLPDSMTDRLRLKELHEKGERYLRESMEQLRKTVANVKRHAKLAEDGDAPIVIVHGDRP